MNRFQLLFDAMTRIPAGRYAAGISGGADSVALMHLLRDTNHSVVVTHLNHQTRGWETDEDARFTGELTQTLGMPFVLGQRDQIEATLPNLPRNPQARYRALRLELFRQVIAAHHLDGVLLAHHADDQAETLMLRLQRSAGIEGLRGIPATSLVGGVRIFRPLLAVPGKLLREYLQANHWNWREDTSNTNPKYQRNRVRILLRDKPHLTPILQQLAADMGQLGDFLEEASPQLPEQFPLERLQGQPRIFVLHALRKWLLQRGVPANEISQTLLARVSAMVEDAASPHALCIPGGGEIRRRGGIMLQVR